MANFDLQPGKLLFEDLDTGQDKFPSAMGVMNIARPMIDIEDLSRLGEGTE